MATSVLNTPRAAEVGVLVVRWGLNYKRYVLTILLNEGKNEVPAVIPQSLQGPYFSSFIDATSLKADSKARRIPLFKEY